MSFNSIQPPLTNRLAGFAELLRRRGMEVGIGDEATAAEALDSIDILNLDDFRSSLELCLIKSLEDRDTFRTAFREYWLEGGASLSGRPGSEHPEIPWSSRSRGGDHREEGHDVETSRGQIFRYSPDAPPIKRTFSQQERSKVASIRKVAKSFRREVATLPGRRTQPSVAGGIDFRRSMRAWLRGGGEWIGLRYHRQQRLQTRLVVMWDLSGSMDLHTSDAFACVHSLVRAIPRSSVFGFSTRIEPLHDLIRGVGYTSSLEAISAKVKMMRGGTKIGACLSELRKTRTKLSGAETVLLIISDGWDVGDLDLMERELKALRRTTRLLLWVNPHAASRAFRPEASGMRRALPYIDLLLPLTALTTRNAYVQRLQRPLRRKLKPASRAVPPRSSRA